MKKRTKKRQPTIARPKSHHEKRAEEAREKRKKRRISDEIVYATILQMCHAAGPDGSVRPQDIAQALHKEEWQSLLKRIRLFAGKLAQREEIIVLRKGKPADPNDFKGVYKLRIGKPKVEDSEVEDDV